MDRLHKQFDQFTQEANLWVTALNMLCELITAKLKQDVAEAKQETVALQVK